MSQFWEYKSLEELNPEEWEKLCDRCGRCCLNKLQDVDTDEILETNVACHLLDCETGRCRDYANRSKIVPDCMSLTSEMIKTINWLPPTCAYRLKNEGKDIPDWHPLKSGSQDTVEVAGVSVAKRCISENDADDLENYIVNWMNK